MSRTELLNKLLNMSSSLDEINNQLNRVDWVCYEDLVVLTRTQICNALRKYQEGQINNKEIERWANSIENREDVGREELYKNIIDKILYELANPDITGQLTNKKARILIDILMQN